MVHHMILQDSYERAQAEGPVLSATDEVSEALVGYNIGQTEQQPLAGRMIIETASVETLARIFEAMA